MSKKPTENRLVWVDLETTGLDPEKDLTLEVAVVVTDGSLHTLDDFCAQLQFAPDGLRFDDFVTEMHTRNGLWQACEVSAFDIFEIESECLRLLERTGAQGAMLAGSTVHFDRSFLKVDLPDFEKALHYRNLDVSSIKAFVKQKHPNAEFPYAGAHRAMPDILESIECLDIARGYLK